MKESSVLDIEQPQIYKRHQKQSNYTSPYKGVNWTKFNCKWRVTLHMAGKNIHLGYYTDVIEAARAYNVSAIKYFGAAAILNNI